MAKYTKEEYALAKKQSDELFALILKKTGTSRSKLYELAKHEFVAANLDVVTSDERKQFDRLVFGL
ncbi:MAG: hypothetical protein LBL94_03740 [Prevotellaceae bacterium]|jgi:hypothetical protein|nr:hypothetical protein [Prevotellaceae bacterium]